MADKAYGYKHQQARRRWNEYLTVNGPIPCRRCGQPVYCDRDAHLNRDGRKFHLGHNVPVVAGGDGSDAAPEEAYCNQKAGAGLANSTRNSRDW